MGSSANLSSLTPFSVDDEFNDTSPVVPAMVKWPNATWHIHYRGRSGRERKVDPYPKTCGFLESKTLFRYFDEGTGRHGAFSAVAPTASSDASAAFPPRGTVPL